MLEGNSVFRDTETDRQRAFLFQRRLVSTHREPFRANCDYLRRPLREIWADGISRNTTQRISLPTSMVMDRPSFRNAGRRGVGESFRHGHRELRRAASGAAVERQRALGPAAVLHHIHLADIDGQPGSGLTGRGSDGLHTYRYNKNTQAWRPAGFIPELNDSAGWDMPEHYSAIQLADIDGRPGAELAIRGADGLHVYRYYSKGRESGSPLDHSGVERCRRLESARALWEHSFSRHRWALWQTKVRGR